MASTIEDTFFEFDINYLHSTSDNTDIQSKLEKYRKSILNLKRKTISTNSLVKKYYAKREQLEQAEKNLFDSKEECKKICIDYRNALETCNKLENDIQLLQNANKELEEKYFIAENQCIGLKSHANQLQQLVSKHECEIEALKTDKKFSKTSFNTNSKKYSEKQFNTVKKENNTLRKHISLLRDVALGKRKLNSKHKVLLEKYEDYDGSCSESGDKSEDHDDYVFSPPPSPICMEDDPPETNIAEISNTQTLQKSRDIKINKGNDSSEILKRAENDGSSVDTGRGSSLACSDSEKFIQSPSYFSNDSPLSDISPNSRQQKQYTDVATSPILILETVEVCTSPISWLLPAVQSEHSNHAEMTTNASFVNTSNCLTAERCISPVEIKKGLIRSIFSPLRGKASEVATLVLNKNRVTKNVILPTPNREKACLEMNNSNNFCNENSNDCEIEEILKKMRLHNPMTPMPQTPNLNRASTCISITENSQTEYRTDFVHPDVSALKEEIKILRDCILENNKGMIDIKNMLQNEILPRKKYEHTATHLDPVIDDSDAIVYSNENEVLNIAERLSSTKNMLQNEILPQKKSEHSGTHLELIIDDSDATVYSNENNVLNNTEQPSCAKNMVQNEISPQKKYEHTATHLDLVIDDSDAIMYSNENKVLNNTKRLSSAKNMLQNEILLQKISEHSGTHLELIIDDSDAIAYNNENNVLNNTELLSCAKNMLQNEILPQKKYEHTATHLDLVIDDSDAIIYGNENDVLKNTERPSSAQTIIIEPKEQTLVRSLSLSIQDLDTCDNENLFVEKPNIIKTNQCVSTAVNSAPHVSFEFEDSVPFPAEVNTDHYTTVKINRTTNTIIDVPDGNNQMLNKHDNVSMRSNRRKLSKLSKLKRKMIPKYKISHANKPTQRKKKLKPKPIAMEKKRKVLDSDNSASLNEKSVYEKAVKVMSEIKANPSIDLNRSIPKVILVKCNELSEPNNILELINDIKSKPITSPPKTTPICKKTIEKNVAKETIKHPLHSKDVGNVNTNNNCKRKSRRNSNRDKFENEPVGMKIFPKHCDMESNKILTNNRRVTRSNTTNIIQTSKKVNDVNKTVEAEFKMYSSSENIRRSLKRPSQDADVLETPIKRMLRSSVTHTQSTDNNHLNTVEDNERETRDIYSPVRTFDAVESNNTVNKEMLCYNDLDMFSENNCAQENPKSNYCNDNSREKDANRGFKNNILFSMLQKHGVTKASFKKKKVSDKTINAISEKLEQHIGKIIEMSDKEAKNAMDYLVTEIQYYDMKEFIYALIKYLQDPQRKLELYNKVIMPPAPAMSKSEQVLLYVISQLNTCWVSDDFLEKVLSSIEYALFAINRTPEFNVIESMSHFYAILCRYFERRCRLRLFMLDAMYCLQFKSIALIKQCIDVWMHVLPLAHMGIAKSPLVTCLVYLLHFYKCEDKFNRVSDIRNILNRKYFFNITDWNESSILEMFRTAIMEMRGNTLQRKMLRTALMLLAKRLGPQWCQKHIINHLLKPIIQKNNVKESITVFCISMIGPLLKPYPMEMKVHCEIVTNELVDMLQKPASKAVQEAIVTSLLCLSRQNQNHVIQALLNWEPDEVSPKLEEMLRNYIRSKPEKVWKSILSKVFLLHT